MQRLQDLNPQIGDVVSYLRHDNDEWVDNPIQWTICSIRLDPEYGSRYFGVRDSYPSDHKGTPLSASGYWVIIKRAEGKKFAEATIDDMSCEDAGELLKAFVNGRKISYCRENSAVWTAVGHRHIWSHTNRYRIEPKADRKIQYLTPDGDVYKVKHKMEGVPMYVMSWNVVDGEIDMKSIQFEKYSI